MWRFIDKMVINSNICFSTYAHKLCNFTVAVGVVPFAVQATPGCSHLSVELVPSSVWPTVIMESYINITNQSFNGTTDDIYFDVPLFATYLNIFLLLVAMPAIIIPAVLVIRIILQTEELHTIYYLFVIDLLFTDILNTLKMGFEIVLVCLYLFGINADTTLSFIMYSILSIPRAAARLSFINLAIDRFIAIAFPYRHKSIMTYKRAYIMLLSKWIISIIMGVVAYSASSFAFVGSFGVYTALEKSIGRVILFVLIVIVTVILIICVNAYLYVQITKSKQKLEENRRVHGRSDNEEIKQLKQTYYKFRNTIKTTFSLLILGGVDGIINLLTMMAVIMNRMLSVSNTLYAFQFVVYPLLCIQLISHSLMYGMYMKPIRRRLCKCQLYRRLQRRLPLRPAKVTVLHPNSN